MDKKTYAIIDTSNLFFRARHVAFRASSPEEKVSYALHITLSSINKVVRQFKIDHVVFALEGRSWRKDVYKPYKQNRRVARLALSQKEQEEDRLFWDAYETLCNYLTNSTNCSIIKVPTAEGDDIIARWIHLHPNDDHVIISTDSDFIQLLSNNVKLFNGVNDELFTLNGIYNSNHTLIVDKKTKEPKVVPDPEWALFEKCIRGDISDNIFSAYPGVRIKGSKNKTGLLEAYADRKLQGYAWNNLMLQRWVDHNKLEHKVIDDYNRNKMLIDLTAQPDDIKVIIDTCIKEQIKVGKTPQVGIKFMQFCGKFDLIRIGDQAEEYSRWLNSAYTGVLNND